MNPLVIATNNSAKAEELLTLLAPLNYHLQLQSDFFSESAVEDGETYIENALKKARFASEKTGLPAIADDSGLSVDALGGKPGIFSARFAQQETGEIANDEKNRKVVLQMLEGLPYSQRGAHYCCAIAYVKHPQDPEPIIGYGTWKGEILTQERTHHRVGYDSIFWDYQHCKTASEFSPVLKNKISHRAQAANAVMSQMDTQNYYG